VGGIQGARGRRHHTREGFDYAVQNGADFLCVGMFDFQVQEDVQIARKRSPNTNPAPALVRLT